MKDVKGLPSRATATRLATILLVVPRNVMAFQTEEGSHVELRTANRMAAIDVDGGHTTVTTRVGSLPERIVSSSDKEAARVILRFFNPHVGE